MFSDSRMGLGTALFFRHDVWQRQTPVKNRKLLRSVRVLLNLFTLLMLCNQFKLVFKRKSCHWLPNLNLSVDMRVSLAHASRSKSHVAVNYVARFSIRL